MGRIAFMSICLIVLLVVMAVFVLGWTLGVHVGGRSSDNYWAMHNGGPPVHHKGKFYLVADEQVYRMIQRSPEELEQYASVKPGSFQMVMRRTRITDDN